MPIPGTSSSSDKDVFYSDRFKTMVRSEKELFLRSVTNVPIMERNVLYAYRNDFYRLLRAYNVQPHMYWAVAYLNGIEDPTQDITHLTSFYNIDENILTKAMARSSTVRG